MKVNEDVPVRARDQQSTESKRKTSRKKRKKKNERKNEWMQRISLEEEKIKQNERKA